MPQKLDSCVKKMEGKINPRTKKPFTRSEKFAICTAAVKKSYASSISDDELNEALAAVDNAMKACQNRMLRSKRARNMNEATDLCEKEFAKAQYDTDRLEFNLDLDLIRHWK